MNRRLLFTASTAASLCGLYVLYALVVTPVFTPHLDVTKPPTGPWKREGNERYQSANEREAARYLGDQPWAADAKYQVRTEEAYFYAEEWDQIPESKKVRFRPFALLWRSKGEPANSEPIAIMAESALVEFASKFDVKTNPRPGRIVGGSLEGVVRVRGPKGLSIVGRNFNFSENALRAWSDNPIAFRYGPNKGQGHGMELDLIPENGPPGDDKPAIAGVRTVRLLRDVVMELESEPKGTRRPADHVTITCAGNFDYGVESHVAAFHKDVRVAHPTGDRQFDRLNSDILTLVFEPERPAEPAVVAQEGAPPPQGPFSKSIDPELGFRRLRAEGMPAVLVSERGDLRTTMTELTYDAQSKVLAMRSAQQVRLTQKNNEIVCPEITAEHDDDGEILRAVCRGAGKLTRFDLEQPLRSGKRAAAFTAEWSKQLQKQPDQQSQLDLIELEGNAQVHQTGQLAMRAGIIRLWIEPDAKEPAGGRVSKSARRDPGDSKARPKRMLALNQVTFGSPQITGDTERLEVWFEPRSLPTTPAERPASAVRQNEPVQPAKGVVIAPAAYYSVPPILTADTGRNGLPTGRKNAKLAATQPDARPSASPAGKRGKGASKSRETDRPVHISAKLIRVRALVEGDQTDVAEVITEGTVVVTQQHDAGTLPLKITGDQLHLWNHSELHQVVDVHGKPAQIRDRGMELEGKTIHFDRGENLVRVEGKGLLRLPVKNTLDGKPLAQAKALDIWWNEQMRFDGETARFFVGVRAALDQDELRCEEMVVTLARRISFADGPDDSQDTDVRTVVCRDGVEIKSHEYEGNRLVGVRKATGFEFSMNQQTGAISAAGPGMLEFLRRGSAKRAGLEPATGVKANRPLQTDPVNWEYTRVDFAGNMEGNSIDRTSTFRDRVRILYGPVDRVTDTIDQDDLPKDGGWLRCDALSLQQHPESRTQKAWFEILGSGNAELEGRSFHALGDNISYDESKGLYIIAANGRREATIWREVATGGKRSMVSAKKFQFIPALNELHVDEASSFQGTR